MLFAVALLLSGDDASAQCAAKVSSCALCHATSDRAPARRANADWHRDHSIGDFCAGCHGGEPAAAGEHEAHVGLVNPLVDPARSCAPCHEGGFTERAQRYAARLADRAPSPPAPRASPASAPASRDEYVAALAVIVAALGGALVLFNERRRQRGSV